MASKNAASAPVSTRASERAYQEIRALILTGDVAPGAPLTEEALADIVGVSRTPVREALRRLEAELYVRRSESQRLFVANWSRDDLTEMFALRAMLEAHAAARAATRISDAALADLQTINARIAAVVSRAGASGAPDIAAFLPENRLSTKSSSAKPPRRGWHSSSQRLSSSRSSATQPSAIPPRSSVGQPMSTISCCKLLQRTMPIGPAPS